MARPRGAHLTAVATVVAIGLIAAAPAMAMDCPKQSIVSGPLNQIAQMYSPGSTFYEAALGVVNSAISKIAMGMTALAFFMWIINRWLRSSESPVDPQWFLPMGWKLVTLSFMMAFALGAFGAGGSGLKFGAPPFLTRWVPSLYAAAAQSGFSIASSDTQKCYVTAWGSGGAEVINPGAIMDIGIEVSFAPIWPSFIMAKPAGNPNDSAWTKAINIIKSVTNKVIMMTANWMMAGFLLGWCLGMFGCFCMLAWSVLVAIVEAYTSMYGAIQLALLPWRATAPFAEAYLKYITTQAVQFFVMFGVIGVGWAITNQFVSQEYAIASGSKSILEYPGTMLAHFVMMFFWALSARHIPKMVTAMVSGVPALNGPEALGSAMAATAAGAAGAASVGKALAPTIGAGLANTVGGAIQGGMRGGLTGAALGALMGAGKTVAGMGAKSAAAGARNAVFGPTALGKNSGPNGGASGGKGPQGANSISGPGAGKWDSFLNQLVNGPGKGDGPGGKRDESAFDRIQNRFEQGRKSFDHERNRGSIGPAMSVHD